MCAHSQAAILGLVGARQRLGHGMLTNGVESGLQVRADMHQRILGLERLHKKIDHPGRKTRAFGKMIHYTTYEHDWRTRIAVLNA